MVGSTASLDAKGLIRSLYDFGFTSLIAMRVLRFVYAILVILYSIFVAILFVGFLASGKGAGVAFAIIFVPIMYLLYLILLRIWMEIIVVFFKIGEDVHAIRHRGGPGLSMGIR